MERLHIFSGCYFFMACRPDRPKESYSVDFSSDDALDYVPKFRFRCGLAGSEIFRNDWRMNLSADQLPFVDGRRTIREVAGCVGQSGASRQGGMVDVEEFTRNLFQSLWRLDFFAMGRRPSGRLQDPALELGAMGYSRQPVTREPRSTADR